LPSWNFNKDHYNRADAEKLGPYNFTSYWIDDKDPYWFMKYGNSNSNRPNASYLEPISHQALSRN